LNLKGLPYEAIPVNLLRDGGAQHGAEFWQRNPARLVPVLQHDALTLTQSLAIIEYLEEIQPTPRLLPQDVAGRARVRALALSIACDIHPLNNLRVLRYLKSPLALPEETRTAWSHHWISLGLSAIERTLAERTTIANCCFGDAPTVADCCLIPQVFNAQRINCPLDEFPRIVRIYQYCTSLDAFQRAAPGAQPDAE